MSFKNWQISAMQRAGIPEMFVEIISARLDNSEAFRAVSDDSLGVLVLSGQPGCGKTVAACHWLSIPIQRDDGERYSGTTLGTPLGLHHPLFVTAARLARWDRYDARQMDRLLLADRLVLDDLGSEYADAKGNFNAILDELVSDRHANKRPMIMSTNLDAAAFKERYDERIADRIREAGKFVSLGGTSMRRRKDP